MERFEYFECVGDDLASMPGASNFKRMAKLKAGETIFFSFIVYRNKAHRNAVNKKVMASMPSMPKEMPFDMKRMAFGGFRTLVEQEGAERRFGRIRRLAPAHVKRSPRAHCGPLRRN